MVKSSLVNRISISYVLYEITFQNLAFIFYFFPIFVSTIGKYLPISFFKEQESKNRKTHAIMLILKTKRFSDIRWWTRKTHLLLTHKNRDLVAIYGPKLL